MGNEDPLGEKARRLLAPIMSGLAGAHGETQDAPVWQGIRVALGNRRTQAAEMVIEPGGAEGGPDNRHRGADQWLFVVAGTGPGPHSGPQSPSACGHAPADRTRRPARDPQHRPRTAQDAQFLQPTGLPQRRDRTPPCQTVGATVYKPVRPCPSCSVSPAITVFHSQCSVSYSLPTTATVKITGCRAQLPSVPDERPIHRSDGGELGE